MEEKLDIELPKTKNSKPKLKKPTSTTKEEKKIQLKEKLESISKQIEDVRKQREELEIHKKSGNIISTSIETRYAKRKFQHPNIPYVYGELAWSPYLTKPVNYYPLTATKGIEKLRNLKHSGLRLEDLPAEDRPYKITTMRKIFHEEIMTANDFYFPEDQINTMGGRPVTVSSIALSWMLFVLIICDYLGTS